MTTLSNPQITLPLDPMPFQVRDLRRLQAAGELVRLACWQQATLARRAGLDVSLAALLGGPPHHDRTVSGEMMGLVATHAVGWAPLGLLAAAIQEGRGEPHDALPASGPVHVWGNRLLRGVCIDGVWLESVDGLLLAPVDHLPADQQRIIRSDTLTPVGGPADVSAAGLSGWACVEETPEGWQLSLELA